MTLTPTWPFKITPEGRVKLLDFSLAKAAHGDGSPSLQPTVGEGHGRGDSRIRGGAAPGSGLCPGPRRPRHGECADAPALCVRRVEEVQRLSGKPLSDYYLALASYYSGERKRGEAVLDELGRSSSASSSQRARSWLAARRRLARGALRLGLRGGGESVFDPLGPGPPGTTIVG